LRVAAASVRDVGLAGAVVFAPDYGSKDIYQIRRFVLGGCFADTNGTGSLA
jgi:hypothetical protein